MRVTAESNMVFPLSLALNASAEIATAADWPNFRYVWPPCESGCYIVVCLTLSRYCAYCSKNMFNAYLVESVVCAEVSLHLLLSNAITQLSS
jgi:hypothetical protein